MLKFSNHSQRPRPGFYHGAMNTHAHDYWCSPIMKRMPGSLSSHNRHRLHRHGCMVPDPFSGCTIARDYSKKNSPVSITTRKSTINSLPRATFTTTNLPYAHSNLIQIPSTVAEPNNHGMNTAECLQIEYLNKTKHETHQKKAKANVSSDAMQPCLESPVSTSRSLIGSAFKNWKLWYRSNDPANHMSSSDNVNVISDARSQKKISLTSSAASHKSKTSFTEQNQENKSISTLNGDNNVTKENFAEFAIESRLLNKNEYAFNTSSRFPIKSHTIEKPGSACGLDTPETPLTDSTDFETKLCENMSNFSLISADESLEHTTLASSEACSNELKAFDTQAKDTTQNKSYGNNKTTRPLMRNKKVYASERLAQAKTANIHSCENERTSGNSLQVRKILDTTSQPKYEFPHNKKGHTAVLPKKHFLEKLHKRSRSTKCDCNTDHNTDMCDIQNCVSCGVSNVQQKRTAKDSVYKTVWDIHGRRCSVKISEERTSDIKKDAASKFKSDRNKNIKMRDENDNAIVSNIYVNQMKLDGKNLNSTCFNLSAGNEWHDNKVHRAPPRESLKDVRKSFNSISSDILTRTNSSGQKGQNQNMNTDRSKSVIAKKLTLSKTLDSINVKDNNNNISGIESFLENKPTIVQGGKVPFVKRKNKFNCSETKNAAASKYILDPNRNDMQSTIGLSTPVTLQSQQLVPTRQNSIKRISKDLNFSSNSDFADLKLNAPPQIILPEAGRNNLEKHSGLSVKNDNMFPHFCLKESKNQINSLFALQQNNNSYTDRTSVIMPRIVETEKPHISKLHEINQQERANVSDYKNSNVIGLHNKIASPQRNKMSVTDTSIINSAWAKRKQDLAMYRSVAEKKHASYIEEKLFAKSTGDLEMTQGVNTLCRLPHLGSNDTYPHNNLKIPTSCSNLKRQVDVELGRHSKHDSNVDFLILTKNKTFGTFETMKIENLPLNATCFESELCQRASSKKQSKNNIQNIKILQRRSLSLNVPQLDLTYNNEPNQAHQDMSQSLDSDTKPQNLLKSKKDRTKIDMPAFDNCPILNKNANYYSQTDAQSDKNCNSCTLNNSDGWIEIMERFRNIRNKISSDNTQRVDGRQRRKVAWYPARNSKSNAFHRSLGIHSQINLKSRNETDSIVNRDPETSIEVVETLSDPLDKVTLEKRMKSVPHTVTHSNDFNRKERYNTIASPRHCQVRNIIRLAKSLQNHSSVAHQNINLMPFLKETTRCDEVEKILTLCKTPTHSNHSHFTYDAMHSSNHTFPNHYDGVAVKNLAD